MAFTRTAPPTLVAALTPTTSTARLAAGVAVVLLGTLLLTLSAKISVPVWPVPVTLQTFAVAALAAALGLRLGVATVALYLLEGLSGLPVFTAGGGPGYLVGPTGGFLVGFLPMAALIGIASDRGLSRRTLALFGAMLAGDAVLFAFGFSWLLLMGSGAAWIDQNDVVASAFAKAVQPFIVWDVVKMVLATVTVSGALALIRRRD